MSTEQNTVKTRIFIISDTHEDLDKEESFSKDGAFRQPLPKSDVLLHSGDLTMIGTPEEYRRSLEMLKGIDAELKLVIAGNHDLSLDEPYYLNDKDRDGLLYAERWMGSAYKAEYADQAREIWTGPEAVKAGVTYLTEGLHTFNLNNGATFTIYASPWQPHFGSWAFNYPHNEDRWNPPALVEGQNIVPAPPERDPHPIPVGAKVDFMMTHGPPHTHLDTCKFGPKAGCPHLLKALNRVRPRLHCFGHIHEAWGCERVTWASRNQSVSAGNETGGGKVGETTEILGGRNDGNMGVSAETANVIRPDDKDVIDRRAAYLDVSSSCPNPLRPGEETLLVNSCVVDLGYDFNNAGWLLDLELPLANSKPI